MTERIGVLVGMEEDFPPAFIAKVNERPGFHAELVRLGGISERSVPPYRVIVDRISHEVPFYRHYLKIAALHGTYVINDPFWWSADDKFFGFTLAEKIGVKVPRTMMLPSKSYIPGIDPNRSLRNLEFPLDWQGIADYVGFPAILKPADGGGWKNVSRVDNLWELLRDYDQSGQLVMTLQQFIDFDDYVRCICIGREHIRAIRYDPKRRCYLEDEDYLPKSVMDEILEGAHALNRALGYDMNSVEFAIKDGVPYAIDFTNPAPDMYRHNVLPKNFDWCIEKMADFACAVALRGGTMHDGYAFQRYLSRIGTRGT